MKLKTKKLKYGKYIYQQYKWISNCLDFCLNGSSILDSLVLILAKINLFCKVPNKTQKYLYNTCLYLAKMVIRKYTINDWVYMILSLSKI